MAAALILVLNRSAVISIIINDRLGRFFFLKCFPPVGLYGKHRILSGSKRK
jgi:hypothetical protein